MKHLSLRERARAAGRELDKAGAGFEFGDLSGFLEVKTRAEEKSLKRAVQDVLLAGDFKRREDGLLSFVPRQPGAPGKEEVMWRFLRLNRQASVLKLMAVSGAATRTVVDFGQRLVNRGLAVKTADGFRLLQDPGSEVPFDEPRSDRARAWREKKQQALASLDAVYTGALDVMQKAAEARLAVSELEEG
jgi:hypothetical protein